MVYLGRVYHRAWSEGLAGARRHWSRRYAFFQPAFPLPAFVYRCECISLLLQEHLVSERPATVKLRILLIRLGDRQRRRAAEGEAQVGVEGADHREAYLLLRTLEVGIFRTSTTEGTQPPCTTPRWAPSLVRSDPSRADHTFALSPTNPWLLPRHFFLPCPLSPNAKHLVNPRTRPSNSPPVSLSQ